MMIEESVIYSKVRVDSDAPKSPGNKRRGKSACQSMDLLIYSAALTQLTCVMNFHLRDTALHCELVSICE